MILGIDLGTTNSCVAVWRDGRAQVIESAERERTTPTAVTQPEAGVWQAGAMARWQAHTNPEWTYWGLKRILGRRFDAPHVAQARALAAFSVEESPDGWAWVRTRDGLKSPQEILAHVIAKLRRSAELHLGQTIGHCVLTVPAYFGAAEKEAARDAARMAGLEVQRFLAEPSAAALAYGLERGANKTIAVFDFGGGTFDVSILRVRGRRFDVLANTSDLFLGGDDFDQRIVDYVAGAFEAAHGVDVRAHAVSLQRLRDEARVAKERLSALDVYDIALPYIAQDPAGDGILDLTHRLTRAELEAMCADLIAAVDGPVEAALKGAKVRPRDIDEVILIGGMTAMPAVRAAAERLFERVPRTDISPDTAVAEGAAIRAAALAGEIRSVTLSEPLAHGLGVELEGGEMKWILKRGAVPPLQRKLQVFTTSADGQTAVAVRLYEGDLVAAAENRPLGVIVLGGIAPRPAGEARIDITMDVDAEGVLTVTAADLDSRETVEASVHVATGLARAEYEALASLE